MGFNVIFFFCGILGCANSNPYVIQHNIAVRKFKIFVILVLIAAAVTVTVLVYKFSSNTEQQTLQLEYNDYAAKFFTNFYHLKVRVSILFLVNSWLQYEVSVMWLPHVTFIYLCLLSLHAICTNRIQSSLFHHHKSC